MHKAQKISHRHNARNTHKTQTTTTIQQQSHYTHKTQLTKQSTPHHTSNNHTRTKKIQQQQCNTYNTTTHQRTTRYTHTQARQTPQTMQHVINNTKQYTTVHTNVA